MKRAKDIKVDEKNKHSDIYYTLSKDKNHIIVAYYQVPFEIRDNENNSNVKRNLARVGKAYCKNAAGIIAAGGIAALSLGLLAGPAFILGLANSGYQIYKAILCRPVFYIECIENNETNRELLGI